jgi:putative oxidoreductase
MIATEENVNTPVNNFAALVGRISLASMFLLAGFNKIGGFDGTAAYIASVGLPLPKLLTGLAIIVEVVGGLALVIGFKARLAALVLAGFTLVASYFFHNFWLMAADQQAVNMLMFMKNIAVTGGMLMVFAFGPGAWSVDGRR